MWQPEVISRASRSIGFVLGVAAGACAYFLFRATFWQAFAIAWFSFLLFAVLTAILLAVHPKS